MLICLLIIAIILPCVSHSAEIITLKDGSQIRGDLVSLNNGVYSVQTAAMGTINITAGNIVNITNEGATPTQQIIPSSHQQPNMDAVFQQQQAQLMSNPEAIAAIQQMAQDPEIMKILSDPALIQSVTSRDINGVSNNPKTQELLNNPKMKALLDQLQSTSK